MGSSIGKAEREREGVGVAEGGTEEEGQRVRLLPDVDSFACALGEPLQQTHRHRKTNKHTHRDTQREKETGTCSGREVSTAVAQPTVGVAFVQTNG